MSEDTRRDGPKIFVVLQSSLQHDTDDRLYCSVCNHEITTQQQRIRIDGKHEHTFTNPAGYEFEIGSFLDAPGCMQAGTFTEENTWFEGCSWKYALCANCRAHLGWMYRCEFEPTDQDEHAAEASFLNRGDTFYGLVLDRLVPIEQSSRN